MPGKTEIRVTFGTRNKLPVLRENSVEVYDMIPAFLDQNMSWFSLSHFRPKYVIFPALFKINKSQNVRFSPSYFRPKYQEFYFPVSEVNRCSREATDNKCICGYNPPEALRPDIGCKLFYGKDLDIATATIVPLHVQRFTQKTPNF